MPKNVDESYTLSRLKGRFDTQHCAQSKRLGGKAYRHDAAAMPSSYLSHSNLSLVVDTSATLSQPLQPAHPHCCIALWGRIIKQAPCPAWPFNGIQRLTQCDTSRTYCKCMFWRQFFTYCGIHSDRPPTRLVV